MSGDCDSCSNNVLISDILEINYESGPNVERPQSKSHAELNTF